MKTPDFKKLYKPYSKMVSLEETITWLNKECQKKGVHPDLVTKAVNETFLEMAGGKTFAMDGGDTGFDNVPHALLNIYMMEKAVEYHNKGIKAYLEATQGTLQARIETYVKRNKRREYWQHLKRNSKTLKILGIK